MIKLCGFGLLLLVASVLSNACTLFARDKNSSKQTISSRAPSPAELLSRAIFSARVAPNSTQHLDDSMALLLLFDRQNSPEALRQFVDLQDVYLGEWPSALYSCIAVRKGRLLLPYLSNSLSNKGRCAEHVKEFSDQPKDISKDICLSQKDRVESLRSLVQRISKGEICSDQELEEIAGY